MYQVLARKWRPKSFDELVGQDHVARTLRNSIEAKRLAHAYIFAGLRGTGKTTVARILAKCLNCEKGPTATPCGKCAPCREIAEGRAMDVLEMDAATRTGVDDVRELQEVVAFAPARDRYKVLIIDEAHMLSKQAANALLKTLEEPPERVVFVLATTEVQKLLPTILSRCQVYEFRRVAPREVAAHLRTVCKTEGIEVDDAVLDRIARAGEGSVRDALTLLERVVAFAGNQVAESDALTVLGAVRAERLAEMLAALARRDAPGMLTVLDALLGEGHDLLHVWNELVGALRDLLLARVLPGRADLLARAPEETAQLAAAAAPLTREDLTRAFQILSDVEFGLKGSAQPRFLFEAALIRLADLGAVRPLEEVLAALGSGSPPARPPAEGPAQKKNERAEVAPSVQAPATPVASGGGGSLESFRAHLRNLRPMTDAMLDAASIRWEDDGIHVTFPPASDAVGRQMARKETIELLERAAHDAAGRKVAVTVAVAQGKSAAAAAAPPPPPAVETRSNAEATEPPSFFDAPRGDEESLLENARREPGIAKLLKEFGAHVVEIRRLDVPGETEGT